MNENSKVDMISSDDDDYVVEPKNEYEKEINACLSSFLKEMAGSTSIDSEYDLIKEVLNEENNARNGINQFSNVWKPNIQKYPDAIVKLEEEDLVVFAAEVGDYVIIEFPNNWQESAYGNVAHINEETGNFRIWNIRKKYYTHSNYKSALTAGQIIKLAPSSIMALKDKKVIKVEAVDGMLSYNDTNKTKERGRKKGSKNRTKEEIQVDKIKKEQQKEFRKAKKELKLQIQKIKEKHM